MPPPIADRPRGPVVLAVMGVIIASVVTFIMVVANPGARRTALAPPPDAQTRSVSATPPTDPLPPTAPPTLPVAAPTGPRALPTFPAFDAGPAPTLAPEADQAAFEAAVHDVIRRHSAVVYECYHEASERDPDLHGRFVAKFVIGPNGQIVSTAVTESDVADERVNYCIRMGLIGRATFPSNPGGRFAPVDHPFMLPPQ